MSRVRGLLVTGLTVLFPVVAWAGAGVAHAGAGDHRVIRKAMPVAPPGERYFNGVSCTSAIRCMAVGGSSGEAGTFPLAESWNGVSWRDVAAAGRGLDLSAVSCPAAGLCLAAGGIGVERWNGVGFKLLAAAAKVPVPRFRSISCTSASFCVAVGTQAGSGAEGVLAESWNGKALRALPVPSPAGALQANLSGVSCVSRADCIAVGSYEPSTNDFSPLAEAWNGSAWRMLSTPALSSTDSMLASVSCASATNCVAVGPGSPAALAESWNGTSWTVLPVPAGGPASISCPAPSHCIAAGVTVAGNLAPHTQVWNGSTWTSLPTPNPLTDSASLNAVSCPQATACTAVGTAEGAGALAMNFDGSRWQIVRVSRSDALSGVSCTLATRCMAVGNYINTADNSAVLAQAWRGLKWRLTATPADVVGGLADVSCVSATNCVGVGGSSRGTGGIDPLAEAWDGSAWRVTPAPSPPLGGMLTAVSCAGGACLAIGGIMLAELWNGSAWLVKKPITPRPFASGRLTDVSCVSQARCVAVGFYFQQVQGNAVSLAELWNGRSWRILSPKGTGLASVSCTSATFCMTITGNSAEIWTGSSWHVRKLPGSFGFGPGILAVSCTSRSSCMAVGNYVTNGGATGHDVAVIWNGSAWRRLRTPGRGGGLADVSCTRQSRCIAVGQAGALALAERWNGARWQLLAAPNP
jgi:hypothetical protein